MTAPEIVLTYEDGRWRARGQGFDLVHEDLGALDALIERTVARANDALEVQVRFDFSTLPVWLRQYQPHYCNYVLHVPERNDHA
jgi:hypothetical protein